jgi:hypothetical protein
MSALFKLAGFAVVLAAVFGVAMAAGSTVGPNRQSKKPAPDGMKMSGHEADPIRGLAASEDGLTLELATTQVKRNQPTELRFSVDGKNGPISDYEVTHEKRMHLILVRRDGQGFQHLHPTLDHGTWKTTVTLPDAGAYRVYADFARQGEPHTLAADLTVDGEATYQPFPQPTATDTTDGYKVDLKPHGGLLDFEITKDGQKITTEPYLGAGGHLVALREGDLAFLHVHPDGDGPSFEADLDKTSHYHLYLQFKHAGVVHTAEFTR